MKNEIIKKNKMYIILIIILIIYSIIAYAIYKKKPTTEKNLSYFVTNNSKYVYNKEKKFTKLDNTNEFNWKNYDVYADSNYLGKYKLQYNNKWYIYDEQRNPIKYEGNLIGFSNIDIKVYDFNRENITETEINKINTYLKNENINIVDYNIYDSKIEYDIDNDGAKEKIYRINSKINGNNDNIFSMILVEKNNNLIKVISKVISNQSYDSIKTYDIYGLIDIDNDNNIEIVISENQYSRPDKSNEQIYQFKNKKFEKITE